MPVYQSTPWPIYILHTPNIKCPQSAEVPHSKLQCVHNFDLSTQYLGHTVNSNGSVTLIHRFQSHGSLWGKYANWAEFGSDKVAQTGCSVKVALTRSLWQGPSDKITLTRLHSQVALSRSHWQGPSAKVPLTRLLWQGCTDRSLCQGHTDKVPLTRSLWQGCSDKVAQTGRSVKVALTRSLCQGPCDKVALTRLLWQGCSDKVALTGCSDKVALTRLLRQVALTSTSYWSNMHSANFVWPTLTTYFTLDLGTLAVTNLIWDNSGAPSETKSFSAAFVGIWGPTH